MTASLFLCLDTSTPTARVAILDADGQARFSSEVTADRHAGHLMPLCAEALRAAGLGAGELAGIACGGGPGSFTGLRVGLAAAKGLALPTGVPLYVVSSLEALALDILAVRPGVTAVPCLDAGKGEVYVGAYDQTGTLGGFLGPPATTPLGKAQLRQRADDAQRLVRELAPSARLKPDEVAGWCGSLGGVVLAGNGAARYRERLGAIADVAGPTAVSVGRLAFVQRARGEAADLSSVVPFYGRPPDITVKKTQ